MRDFCQSGGVVVATQRLPEFATGFIGYQENDNRVRAILHDMFGDVPEKEQTVRRSFGKGEAILLRAVSDLPEVLRARLQPDFELEQRTDVLLHLHRRHEGVDVYFVANNSSAFQENAATFRVGSKIPETWNAETGDTQATPVYTLVKNGVRIPLRLKPYESVFYVFREAAEPVHLTETNADEVMPEEGGRVRCRVAHNGICYIRTAGPTQKPNRQQIEVKGLPAPLEISGDWRVTFEAYKFPKLVKQIPLLRSWTDDPDTRHFSGTARYELDFQVPAELLGKGRKLLLDLGGVADASKVWLNGHAAGVTWKRPHQHEVTQWVQSGNNFLEVRVSNRLINAVGGMKKPEWADKVREKYGHYNERNEWYDINVREYGATNLPPAGLLGPVRLVVLQEIEFVL